MWIGDTFMPHQAEACAAAKAEGAYHRLDWTPPVEEC